MVSILKGCPFKFTLRYSGHRASMPLSQAVPYSPTHNRAMRPLWRVATPVASWLLFSVRALWVCQRGSMITHGGIAPPQQLCTTLRRCIEPSWSPTESNCCTTISSISKQGYRTCPAFSATSEEKGKVKEKNFAFFCTGRKDKALCYGPGDPTRTGENL